MNLVIIDNYDSFTYNLSHAFRSLGAHVSVRRNDAFRLEELEEYDKIVLSPGPGIPAEAGLTPDVIHRYAGRKPLLGVCLGHQAIAEVFGGRLENLRTVYHGVQTPTHIINHDYLFEHLPETFEAGRYHSWVVSRSGLPDSLEVTAISDDGHIMALRHRTYDVRGIQFHPESILTPEGTQILQNWLNYPICQTPENATR